MAEAVGAFAVDGGEQRGNHKACNEHRILRNEVRTNESQRQDLVDCNRFFGGNMTSAEEEFRRSDVRKGLRKSWRRRIGISAGLAAFVCLDSQRSGQSRYRLEDVRSGCPKAASPCSVRTMGLIEDWSPTRTDCLSVAPVNGETSDLNSVEMASVMTNGDKSHT